MIGRRYPLPGAPSGMRMASAASGPYEDDASASRPISGTPSNARILRPPDSRLARDRPKTRRVRSDDMGGAALELPAPSMVPRGDITPRIAATNNKNCKRLTETADSELFLLQR